MVGNLRFKSPIRFPVGSFIGMDLKLGVSIISLFAVLNKVAGAYGMMAVLTGGTLAQPLSQLTMYLYSIATLVGVLWGLKKIAEENGPKVLFYAHLFALDHCVGTIFTSLFAVVWYIYVPHDGRRVANSDAQKEMMSEGSASSATFLDDAARKAAAQAVWKGERGFSAAVLMVGWLLKIYFILCLYSYALHLRRNTYATLPKTRPRGISLTFGQNPVHGTRASRAPLGARPQLATRRSLSGSSGHRYTHVRGNSLATDSGTETSMAETLWEEEGSERASTPVLGTGGGAVTTTTTTTTMTRPRRTSLIGMQNAVLVNSTTTTEGQSGTNSGIGEEKVRAGVGVAKTTTTRMNRSLSEGMLQRTDSYGSGANQASGKGGPGNASEGKADEDLTTLKTGGNGPVAAFR
ncbi:BZ3500_MvSof-1268-A1-R1_Chr2-3g05309 [Microbotryum saponariae]|uniref:BZ3500_MvSof-1268-A1-R1_Chr2-3g05309 protein n=1 Tax=Microbotryum saponariae TaxID=289078 RepID=A0A2X0KP41_9BASI|nr:BZ3500_MvSof-1268-A1-R1_Chr2-3g05309 [Microbotryum saponariae]SDA01172.1 BZ3501_MvSof-1269-A2-R1_Chr2-2g04982 [Microbotryum saponariae]